MIHISETLAIQTVEEFLTAEELAQLVKIMDAELRATGWRPRTQAETLPAPAAADEILRHATARALPAMRRGMPSVTADAPWKYIELAAGEEVPRHLDGIPEPDVRPRRLGRIGVTITAAEEGGQFYVETSSSPLPWTGKVLGEAEGYHPGTSLSRSLPHESLIAGHHYAEPDWLADAPTTRWITPAGAGVALVYGAQVIHGVTPVTRGQARRFVTDLTDGTP
ncbi:hypothetical protein I5Q34_29215 [Streptomyces sp. AV19]|uniref:hypothetical protein n=1 Tax=Streptomyces sp. AV19 TaxID=2793068 RepID=UPI0018FF0682|nr:hypothetical protein [Streptomyces sp. AV19]MBH1938291.1 hypothetical protein [Streptomyces sp. AV19]MDG4534929.1 hypothetical protein [Streptomyces sp. AV19]